MQPTIEPPTDPVGASSPAEPGTMPDSAGHALSVNYHAMIANSPDAVVLVDLDQDRLIDANRQAEQTFGMAESALLEHSLAQLCPPVQPDGRPSDELIRSLAHGEPGADGRLFKAVFQHASGRQVECELHMMPMPAPGRRLMHVRIIDVTARNRAERLRQGQSRLLEMVARGAPLTDTLDQLMLLIEDQSEGVYCSVLLLDDDGVSMRAASAPHLPAAYMQALDGIMIGPAVGSCGTAMSLRQTVIVSDILTDPLWAPYRDLAAAHGLRACWSTPIYLDPARVLGSFAMYYREVRSPLAQDMQLIDIATHLAGIAIERTRHERELAQHREHLEELVAARTAALQQAKERTELANEELGTALGNLSLAQDELVRRDKLAALGALVAGIAHELNTPIGNSLMVATTMLDHARALATQAAAGLRRSALDAYLAEAHEAGDIMVRNLQRAATLVASFKQIAVDHTNSQRRRFSLRQLLAELVPALRVPARQRKISLEQAVDGELWMDSYPGPLSQVISNLFDNCLAHAFDGTGGGMIRVSARMESPGTVALAIEDSGAGIPSAIMARVYDPFFTTRLGSGGSGLGLHVVHNIVTGVLGGRIELHSEVGVGTVFTLLLPASAPDFPVDAGKLPDRPSPQPRL